MSWNSVSWNSVSWNSDYWEEGPVSSAATTAGESLADGNLIVSDAPVSTDSAQETSLANTDQQNDAVFKILLPIVTR